MSPCIHCGSTDPDTCCRSTPPTFEQKRAPPSPQEKRARVDAILKSGMTGSAQSHALAEVLEEKAMSTNCIHEGCAGYLRCRVKPRDLPKPITAEDLGHLECWIRTGRIGFDDARRVNTLIEAYNDLVTRAEKAREELEKLRQLGRVTHSEMVTTLSERALALLKGGT